jgi:hypothetical protein
MPQIKKYASTLLLATALAGPLLAGGCAARVRVYDEYHSDYHYWNDGEVRAYRVWIGERHYDYREYNRLNREQQREYWAWRHEHPGRY